MDGVEKINSRILKDAQKEADKILSEAKKEVSSIKSDANAESKHETDRILKDGKKRADAEKQRILSSANLQAHNLKLASEEALIGTVLGKAMEKIDKLRVKGGADYEKAIKKLVKNSMEELGGGKVVLSFDKKDQKLGKKLAEEFKASLGEPMEIGGGVIVETKDSSLRVDNSFEKMLEREEDSIRSDLAGVLFSSKK
jgi:V/A-type H+-transporting ATPase subunit E